MGPYSRNNQLLSDPWSDVSSSSSSSLWGSPEIFCFDYKEVEDVDDIFTHQTAFLPLLPGHGSWTTSVRPPEPEVDSQTVRRRLAYVSLFPLLRFLLGCSAAWIYLFCFLTHANHRPVLFFCPRQL